MSEHTWQKSSYCSEGSSCLNVAATDGTIHLTESADPIGVILDARALAFDALLTALKKETPRV
ncbi:hypothetical protein M2271_006221 [Streptomyces sp. LBL]|uniref:DUF397 domain-containing protein n=1 Tax=Streptomyces sp. LBL TaxID=2940562 RepID=UPI00247670DA|nr:DUF397 domain-containing protein [Streptomyces sp. LBL]MDH6628388.1 hypothetical protein [Streptomyces sp. LBL]